MLAISTAMLAYLGIFFSLPEDLALVEGEPLVVQHRLPVTMEVPANGSQVIQVENDWLGDSVIQAVSEKGNPGVLAQYKLFGWLPIGGVNIQVIPKLELIPCGQTAGVKMLTDGVMVVGFSDLVSGGKPCNPALEAGIAMKDVITHMNGEPIHSVEDMSRLMEGQEESPIEITLRRGEKEWNTRLTPKKEDEDGCYRIGLWVRDSAAGIGTITFIEPETGFFGGLGHGICDVDTGQLMPLYRGILQESQITEVVQGRKGSPGELQGRYDETKQMGEMMLNTHCGIFGIMEESYTHMGEPVPIALQGEIHEGEATILCNVEGEQVEEFTIQIQKVAQGSGEMGRNMLLKVTDEKLLEKTGGIVQGMSGSPILQDGKLIGAVTHVLIDDPTRGYGIFIENMLRQGKEAYEKGKNTGAAGGIKNPRTAVPSGGFD